MMNLTLTWSGLENVLSDIDMKLEAAKQVITDDLREFGEGAKNEMVRTHPFRNRTFRLEGSIDFDVVPFDYVTVFALTEYASDVEFGVPGRSQPYPYFWPVFWKWAALLEVKIADDWPRALHG